MLDVRKRIFAGAAALSILVVACTTTETSNTSSSGGGARTDGGTDGGPADASDENDGGADDDKCSGAKSIHECAQCCGDSGAVVVYDDAYIACACETPCKEQCAKTICLTPLGEPDDACAECLQSESTFTTCDPQAQAECDKDEPCKEFTTCFLAARCIDKPEG
jgi:hypothetical protein